MKNITLKIDEDTYRRARIRAARDGTSVSAMVREFLRRQAREEDVHANRVAELEALYRVSEARAKGAEEAQGPVEPMTREEIYRERLR